MQCSRQTGFCSPTEAIAVAGDHGEAGGAALITLERPVGGVSEGSHASVVNKVAENVVINGRGDGDAGVNEAESEA